MADISITATAADPDAALVLFDRIEVHRSESGVGGPYIEITAPASAPALLTGTVGGPLQFVNVLGLDLDLELNEAVVPTINFTVAAPATIAQVAAFISSLSIAGLVAGLDLDGKLALSTSLTGTGATLKTPSGTALTELGFAVDQFDNGENPRIILASGVFSYPFTDQSGDETNFYKTRFVSSVSGATSDFSDPQQGTTGTIISAANLVTAKVVLVNVDGSADEGVEVILQELKTPLSIEGATAIGRRKILTTDALGRAETLLIRGSLIEFAIAGTSIARRITVPDATAAPTEFDLLDATLETEDTFGIFTANLPAAVRRTI